MLVSFMFTKFKRDSIKERKLNKTKQLFSLTTVSKCIWQIPGSESCTSKHERVTQLPKKLSILKMLPTFICQFYMLMPLAECCTTCCPS